MINQETLMKFGLTTDKENSKVIKDTLKDGIRLKEVHIDIYPDNPLVNSSTPFLLLLRTIERSISVTNDGNRLIFKKNDDNNTCIMNVLFSEMTECYYNVQGNYFEFILKIQNTYYRITIFN